MKNDYEHLRWTDLGKKKVYETPIFDLYEVRRRSSSGKEGTFVVIDSPDWANVVAVVQDRQGRDCFLMVRQYRQGGGCLSLEFPGGLVDPGESPALAAARELKEETGYKAERLVPLGWINPNPAIMTNRCTTFAGLGLEKNAEQKLDENEIVDTVLVPVEELEREMGSGLHTHAIMVAAFFFYQKWKGEGFPGA